MLWGPESVAGGNLGYNYWDLDKFLKAQNYRSGMEKTRWATDIWGKQNKCDITR